MRKHFLLILSLLIMAVNVFADSSTYLNFTAVGTGMLRPATIRLQQRGYPDSISLQYSVDSCNTWNTYTIGNTINLTNGSTVFFKASNTNSTFSKDWGSYYFFSMGTSDVSGQSNKTTILADGNIMSLLDATMTQTSVPAFAFYNLFGYCTVLSQAPALPATSLADMCYASMFDHCTSLTQAPNLAATTLDYGCYRAMFSSCTSLTNAPVLPALNLAPLCYAMMFASCSSLTQAPSLPANTLDSCCYYCMFGGCTSLTQIPILPATTLSDYCYEHMFSGCTSLNQTPSLPATNLAIGCYSGMFSGCTSLIEPSSLPATNLADSCYKKMFFNCSNLCVNHNAPGTTWSISATNTASGALSDMFTGTMGSMNSTPTANTTYYVNWAQPSQYNYLCFTAVNGPASIQLTRVGNPNSISLQCSTNNRPNWTTYNIGDTINLSSGSKVYFRPGTTKNNSFNSYENYYKFVMTGTISASGNIMSLLYNYSQTAANSNSVPTYAFYYLFDNCSSLIQAPTLPATTLAYGCYYGMFSGCTSLTQVPSFPATTLAAYCYSHMFEGCTSLTQVLDLGYGYPRATSCQSYMFKDCTSLTQVPDLRCSAMAGYCYEGMFMGCTSLTQAPDLPSSTGINVEQACYKRMFEGCTSLTQAPSLNAHHLAHSCYYRMFAGCTSLTQAPTISATRGASFCFYGMFAGCTSLQAPRYICFGNESSCEEMFLGCTSLTISDPGRIYSSTLERKCYKRMFKDCTSLTQIPSLDYHNLADSCYAQMFEGCTSLKVNNYAPGKKWRIPLGAIAEPGWNHDMFAGTGGSFTGEPWINHDYYIAYPVSVTTYVNDTSMGSVSGAGSYTYGQTVTLAATPNYGYHLVRWSNGETNSTITISVLSDTVLTAYFAIGGYNVSAKANRSNWGTVTGGGEYNYNDTATLVATPTTGHVFTGWSNGATSNTIFLQVVSDTTLTANFEIEKFDVYAIVNDSKMGTVTGGGKYDSLDVATLTATPNEGYKFTGWDNGLTNLVINITVTSDTIITANFEPDNTAVDDIEGDYEITLAPNPVKIGETIIINGNFSDEELNGMTVEVIDMNGMVVRRNEANSSPVEIEGVDVAGNYIVRITAGTGKVYTQKLIVK